MGEQTVPGLGVLDIETKRVEGGSHNRLVGNVVLDSPLASMPVVGYENHAGRTFPGAQCQPFGQVIGHHGHGNNDAGGTDGTLHRNIVASYLHGPLLAKNPEVADWLIERALARRAAKEGRAAQKLYMLDDAAERAANDFMRKRR
jgi:CobQ-like glutamine amidotransferase family enzyme